ncbi:MAG: hypothetical protein KGZ71_02925 [Desulfobulbaceae bacterium]|nr:hypothetical protein [Desulfobulbaceae bacterium]
METEVSYDKLILEIRKISYRLINMHKIYSFKLINLDSNYPIDKSFITNVRKRKDIEDSKSLFGNILLRCESLIYYFIKMNDETLLPDGDHNTIKNAIPFDSKLKRIHLQISRNYLFFFDTIINQIISLYEYIANCCSYILIGQHARQFKWEKSINAIRNKKYTELSNLLQLINKIYIDKLSEIRADIFHYNFLGLSSSFSQSIMNGDVEMHFKVDDKIHKYLLNANLVPSDSQKIEIRIASFLIIEKGLELVVEILEELKKSIYTLNLSDLKATKQTDLKATNTGEMFTTAGFNTLLDLQESLLYHWGYFWDDTEKYDKLDYINRSMNKMFMPFRLYPEN